MNYCYVEIAVARAIGLEEAFGTDYFANDSNHRSRMFLFCFIHTVFTLTRV